MATASGNIDVFGGDPSSSSGDQGGPPAGDAGGPGRRGGGHVSGSGRSRGRKAALIVLVILLVLAGAGVFAFERLMNSYDKNIERFGNPFSSLPADSRPTDVAPEALNILLLGSDSRVSAGDPTQWAVGAQRTDAIMIMHIPADRSGAQIVSIPRDSWVPIPGHDKAKINAAFSYGGPSLMVQTVEQLTDVRIDHVAIVDFDGFKEITDELGGVTITVPESTHDLRSNFKAGTQVMNGEQALNYVRQRYNLPGGDFDRVKRQQNWIRAVLTAAVSKGTLTNPLKVNGVLGALTKSLATDDNFTIGEMRSLAVSLRDIRSGDVDFLTAPVAGTGRSPDGKQSIVNLDAQEDAPLWKALAGDKMAAWTAANADDLLGTTVK